MSQATATSTLLKGRGAQFNPDNAFLRQHADILHPEGIDAHEVSGPDTRFLADFPKKILNKVDSTDVGMQWSINPYQGCEHGCVYCYARNSHTYWGYSAGLDFESRIIYKPHAPQLLEAAFRHPSWQPQTVSLSGNTDCYQPVERKMKLTRELLQVCLKYRNPVSIITKSSLVLRDMDILKELAALQLVKVVLSVNGTNEVTREKLEPRTSTYKKRMEVVEQLSAAGIPVGVLIAPVIPGLNDHEMPEVIRRAAKHGAESVGYIVLRLNGAVAQIFEDWVHKAFPYRAAKILQQVKELHGGQLNDSRIGIRMKGEGTWSDHLHALFQVTQQKYFAERTSTRLSTGHFRRSHQMLLHF